MRETEGSLEFPGYPCGHMPRSQTPVVSPTLASMPQGTAAFRTVGRRRLSVPRLPASPYPWKPVLPTSPWTTTIPFSGLSYAACVLDFCSSAHHVSMMHVQSSTSLPAQRWLEKIPPHPCRATSWVTSSNFTESRARDSPPFDQSFTQRDQRRLGAVGATDTRGDSSRSSQDTRVRGPHRAPATIGVGRVRVRHGERKRP